MINYGYRPQSYKEVSEIRIIFIIFISPLIYNTLQGRF
jgi:hypothetical protein